MVGFHLSYRHLFFYPLLHTPIRPTTLLFKGLESLAV